MTSKIIVLVTAIILLPALSLAQQGTITGRITSEAAGDGIVGANVILRDTNIGAAANNDGVYKISNAPLGDYTLVVTAIGFTKTTAEVSISPGMTMTVDIAMAVESVQLSGLEVVAARARHRETPVAFTNIEKADLQFRLGSRDVPMILNTTPGVYATEQGGGAGDSRINIRGFDQRNVAVMINGVPVNDMENGWVYWSNWDGLGDATSSIQIQRGLGASNLAISSVGGTMNILTDAASHTRGVSIKQEMGNGSFLKSTALYNTGLLDNGFAATITAVKKTGKGIADQTWTNAWSYFGALSYLASDNHKFDLFIVGAPQRHGQRIYNQSIALWDNEFAVEAGVSQADADAVTERGVNYNPNWGPINAPAEDLKEYFNGEVHDIRDSNVLMERENFFHKPQYNLNWYWKIKEDLHLTSVFYLSIAKGGGTGGYFGGDWIGSLENGQIDFQTVYNTNSNNIDDKYSATEDRSTFVLRNSVNQHNWYGYIGTAKYRLSETMKLTTGIDLRQYKGEHWREVRNLIGGDYFINTSNKNPDYDANPDAAVKRLGDKIAYHNDGLTRWFGGFAQLENSSGPLTVFGSLSLSQTGYKRIDYFNVNPDGASGGKWETDWENFTGSTVKAGANYNINENVNAYANVGRLSKAPIFDAVYNFNNTLYQNSINETINAIEIGSGYRSSKLFANANYYYTNWLDRSWTTSSRVAGESFYYLLAGIDALHTGIEFDTRYKATGMIELNGMASLGNWVWQNDVEAKFSPEATLDTILVSNVYTDGLKVSDAAQKTYAVGVTLRPTGDFTANLTLKRFTDHYARFDPADRDDPDDRVQAWKIPDYNVIDLHANFALPLGGVNADVGFHVFNLLDTKYITDATDRGDHTAADALVWMGLERRWNLSFNVAF